jgi:hypothetical protein
VKIKGERRAIRVLVLRDPHNKSRRVAKTQFEKATLVQWYADYNSLIKTEEIPFSKKLREKLGLIAGNLRERGFIHSFVCYGTTRDKKTNQPQYKRLEILKATPWGSSEIKLVNFFFKTHIPENNLAFYVYDNRKLYTYPITESN